VRERERERGIEREKAMGTDPKQRKSRRRKR